MSNRPCNYCEYQKLKKKYDNLVLRKAKGKLGGVNVYRGEVKKENLIVWYMELPDSCRC